MLAAPGFSYRTIDPVADADLAVAAYLDACRASYGEGSASVNRGKHLEWLRARVEEFPDGHVIARLDGRYVGQLELQVPYGLSTGYVNLFYVSADFRGRGYGRRMHEYAERYFRSWEADRIELHVSQTNERALGFYRALGYRAARREGPLWRMVKELARSRSDVSP
jgi:ribosomal protein S18 acetylase RimI-like enzyme